MPLGGLVVDHGHGVAIQVGEGDAGLEVAFGVGQRLELFIGRVHMAVGIAAALPAFSIDADFGEEAGAMEVEVRREVVTQEGVDRRGVVAGDMAVARETWGRMGSQSLTNPSKSKQDRLETPKAQPSGCAFGRSFGRNNQFVRLNSLYMLDIWRKR